MAGSYFQLRPNKAIDRAIFIELLELVNSTSDLRDYTYVGFGGTTFEDYKLLYTQLRVSKMISLESKEEKYRRQLFNMPLSCIDANLKSSEEFIEEFDPRGNTVFWLDYSEPEQGQQVQELESLMPKLAENDVLKVTVNANPDHFHSRLATPGRDDLHNKRFGAFKDKFGGDVPDTLDASSMSGGQIARAIGDTFLYRLKRKEFELQGYRLCPLTAFVYQDGQHQMMTMTGIMVNKGSQTIRDKRRDWELWADWNNPITISVPELSVRERLAIDSLLPGNDVDTIVKRLGFRFDQSEDELRNYLRFARFYPYYSEILV